jgi:hypothetical protein
LLIVTTEEWKMRQISGTRKSLGEKIVEKPDPALPLEAHTLKVAKASESGESV